MAAPLPAPMATLAAQRPSIYQPTEHEKRTAEWVSRANRGLFLVDEDAALLPDESAKVH